MVSMVININDNTKSNHLLCDHTDDKSILLIKSSIIFYNTIDNVLTLQMLILLTAYYKNCK